MWEAGPESSPGRGEGCWGGSWGPRSSPCCGCNRHPNLRGPQSEAGPAGLSPPWHPADTRYLSASSLLLKWRLTQEGSKLWRFDGTSIVVSNFWLSYTGTMTFSPCLAISGGGVYYKTTFQCSYQSPHLLTRVWSLSISSV